MIVEGFGVEELMGEGLVREVVYRGVGSPETVGRERTRVIYGMLILHSRFSIFHTCLKILLYLFDENIP